MIGNNDSVGKYFLTLVNLALQSKLIILVAGVLLLLILIQER